MISVCMATYNGERFIKEQIASILPQLSENDELIISDDGSTDRTLEIIEEFHDSRIRVFHHEKIDSKYNTNFHKATRNFENAMKQARGDYIFLSDQDDIWMPNKIERCLQLLEDYDVVVSNYQIIDETGNTKKEKTFQKNPLHKSILMNIIDSHFRGCCMAFKRCILEASLPIPEKIIGHDYWIGAIATKFGKVFYEINPLIQSRWYEGSVSAKKKKTIFYKLKFRFDLLTEVSKRRKRKWEGKYD